MFKDLASELFPPDVPSVTRWRLVMFLWAVITMIHIAWACGLLLYLNLGAGFAKADDVNNMQADLKSLRLTSIEQNLFDMHMKRCSTPVGSEVRVFLAEKIQDLQDEYRVAAGHIYQMPSCSEI